MLSPRFIQEVALAQRQHVTRPRPHAAALLHYLHASVPPPPELSCSATLLCLGLVTVSHETPCLDSRGLGLPACSSDPLFMGSCVTGDRRYPGHSSLHSMVKQMAGVRLCSPLWGLLLGFLLATCKQKKCVQIAHCLLQRSFLTDGWK